MEPYMSGDVSSPRMRIPFAVTLISARCRCFSTESTTCASVGVWMYFSMRETLSDAKLFKASVASMCRNVTETCMNSPPGLLVVGVLPSIHGERNADGRNGPNVSRRASGPRPDALERLAQGDVGVRRET